MPEQPIIRSRYVGLRDFYVALVKTNTETEYATEDPVKVARAVSATISTTRSSEKIYSDDSVEDMLENYEGTELEIELNTLAAADRALLFGLFYKNGWLLSGAEDHAPELAAGYRVRRLNGKYDFVWLYCGRFSNGNEDSHQTLESQATGQTSTITGSFYQRNKVDKLDDGKGGTKNVQLYECRVDESNLTAEDTTAAEAIKEWFSKVQEYKSVEAVALGLRNSKIAQVEGTTVTKG